MTISSILYTAKQNLFDKKIQNRQQANYKDSTVNVYIVVSEWDATFYSKFWLQ